VLRDRGLLFAGIDVIGGFVTEVNVTSPTGIRELERASGLRITEQLFDSISSKLE
jgi:glutathione synthase